MFNLKYISLIYLWETPVWLWNWDRIMRLLVFQRILQQIQKSMRKCLDTISFDSKDTWCWCLSSGTMIKTDTTRLPYCQDSTRWMPANGVWLASRDVWYSLKARLAWVFLYHTHHTPASLFNLCPQGKQTLVRCCRCVAWLIFSAHYNASQEHDNSQLTWSKYVVRVQDLRDTDPVLNSPLISYL